MSRDEKPIEFDACILGCEVVEGWVSWKFKVSGLRGMGVSMEATPENRFFGLAEF